MSRFARGPSAEAFRWLAALCLLATVAACTSTPSRPGSGPVPKPHAPVTTPTVNPTAAVLPPLPSGGFYGPGSFVVTWTGTDFVRAACPAGHPRATCYTGTATTSLPIVGRVTLARTVAIGDSALIPPSGCVTAVTDGTIKNPTGSLTFQALGLLCGRTSAFTVTTSSGSGSMGSDMLLAQIINDSTSETWSGEIQPKS